MRIRCRRRLAANKKNSSEDNTGERTNMIVSRCLGIGPPSGFPPLGRCFCWPPIFVASMSKYLCIEIQTYPCQTCADPCITLQGKRTWTRAPVLVLVVLILVVTVLYVVPFLSALASVSRSVACAYPFFIVVVFPCRCEPLWAGCCGGEGVLGAL